ncbi:MAG: hypothetical protein HBSAPP03_29180 [Phycisphaerae bacterium]|nr:MAG: hypothetical protein HBSAPP03_29180 [Phycisphaerae bacterium]
MIAETLLGLCVGIALAAACGMRVFLPLLAVSLGAHAGVVPLGESFAFLGTWAATLALATAAVVELTASSVPWVEHALDAVATPAAIIAGTILVTSQLDHLHPALAWGLGVVAGGGAAGTTQAAAVTTRGASTAATAGVLNPILNTVQSALSAIVSALAVVVPIVAGAVVLAVAAVIARWWWVRRRKRAGTDPLADVAAA